MSKSIENLKSAFAGESQASMKYRAFALQADAEGFGQAARLFRATELAETIHAHNHLKVLGELGSTQENLHTDHMEFLHTHAASRTAQTPWLKILRPLLLR